MNPDFKKLVKGAKDYEFDPKLLDAIPVTGILRKSPDPKNCILVISNKTSGDLILEIESDDVVKHEVKEQCECTEDREDQVTLYIKPSATVTTSFKGKITNSLIASALMVNSASAQPIREQLTGLPWTEIVSKFSIIDILLNRVGLLGWSVCRAEGRAECIERFPTPGPDRDQCITDRYIECGSRPRLEVGERTLEKLREFVYRAQSLRGRNIISWTPGMRFFLQTSSRRHYSRPHEVRGSGVSFCSYSGGYRQLSLALKIVRSSPKPCFSVIAILAKMPYNALEFPRTP